MPAAPLILTLALDEAAERRFDRLRAEFFPAGRNVLPAHVTLFHALPGEQEEQVRAETAAAAARACFPVAVTGVRFLGRGVAYTLQSPELAALHRELAARWHAELTRQDRQPLAAHVTVQNKAPAAAARALHARLAAEFTPDTVRASGLRLWRYLAGPWAPVAAFPFLGGGGVSRPHEAAPGRPRA